MRTLLITFVLSATGRRTGGRENEGPKKEGDADDAFVTGLRKLGAMSGEAGACFNEKRINRKSERPRSRWRRTWVCISD
jgi:hypothetical protein